MTDNSFWLTKSDGVVNNIGENRYSNSCFVEAVRSDDSPMGKLMQSRFPTETVITMLGDTTPDHWVRWDNRPLNVPLIDKMMVEFTEVPATDRLHLSRGDISTRTREVMSAARMTVTPRGIKNNSGPLTPEELASSIVHGVYHMVEKHTLASMKSQNSPLSADKRVRFHSAREILTERRNVLDIALLNSYIEPSPTMMSRAYHLGAVYGMGMVHAVINDVYHRHYRDQVESVKACLPELSVD